jgi:hypothetical protein
VVQDSERLDPRFVTREIDVWNSVALHVLSTGQISVPA